MDGRNKSIAEILNQGNHYVIPGYQRNYQWSEERWQSLVSDILVAATSQEGGPKHWLGIFLISESSGVIHPGFSGQMEYLVIDGQQRLTTLAIWVAAMVHHAEDLGTPLDYDLSAMAKITVQESDRVPFEVVLNNRWRRNEYWSLQNHQILRAYAYFRYLLWLGQEALAEEDGIKFPIFKKLNSEMPFEGQWAAHTTSKRGASAPRGAATVIENLFVSTLYKINIFSLIHNPVTDETQAVVFDTLNGRRQELEPLDHVRNSLFVRIPDLEARETYRRHWYPAETALRAVPLKNMKPGKAFIYDYVISKGEKKRQKSISASRGASHFAFMTKGMQDSAISNFVEDDLVPSMLTWQVVVRSQDQVTRNGVSHVFSKDALEHMDNIRDLSVGPANPIVLHYATGFILGKVSDAELVEILFLVENYLVRQVLGGRAMSPLRARITDLMGAIDGDYSITTLKLCMAKADWVKNDELLDLVTKKAIYENATPKAIGAIFRGIERAMSGPGSMRFTIGTSSGSFSVEHIYPQRNSRWLPDLDLWGCDANEMDKRRHTLGNLTVVTTGHNSSVGNKSFGDKRTFPTVLGQAPPLSLNRGWLETTVKTWTPLQIDERSIALMSEAIRYWVTL